MSKLGRISFLVAGGVVIAHAIYVETSRQDSPTVLPLTLRPAQTVPVNPQPAAQPVFETATETAAPEGVTPPDEQTSASPVAIEQPQPVSGTVASAGTAQQAPKRTGKFIEIPQILAGRQVSPVLQIAVGQAVGHKDLPSHKDARSVQLAASTAPSKKSAVVAPLSPTNNPPKSIDLLALMPKAAIGGHLPSLHLAALPADSAAPIVVPPKAMPIYQPDERVTWVSNYAQRLAHVNQQIDLGIERKWISADAAQKLKDKFDRLKEVEKVRRSKGYTRGACDQMERDITQFSYWVTEAINGREISFSERENAL